MDTHSEEVFPVICVLMRHVPEVFKTGFRAASCCCGSVIGSKVNVLSESFVLDFARRFLSVVPKFLRALALRPPLKFGATGGKSTVKAK